MTITFCPIFLVKLINMFLSAPKCFLAHTMPRFAKDDADDEEEDDHNDDDDDEYGTETPNHIFANANAI